MSATRYLRAADAADGSRRARRLHHAVHASAKQRGIAMQQMLRFIDAHLSSVRPLSPDNPDYIHLVTEAMKHAFADRATHLADGEQVPVPVDRLLDANYLAGRAETFDMDPDT